MPVKNFELLKLSCCGERVVSAEVAGHGGVYCERNTERNTKELKEWKYASTETAAFLVFGGFAFLAATDCRYLDYDSNPAKMDGWNT
jgi:hypothetical protein